jgi:hypothetical protein
MTSERRERFAAVLGLPRSGTTLLTALLDEHPALCLYFEPFNASPKNRPPVANSADEFRSWMKRRFAIAAPKTANVIGFKETTTNADTTRWALDTVSRLSATCDVTVIWIQRDPIHCLLSKLEGARKWWGYPDAHLSRESLESFLLDTQKSYDDIEALLTNHGGWVVRYEALVRDPSAILETLMPAVGEKFDPVQLGYHSRQLPAELRRKVMGDPGLIESPSAVSVDAFEARTREAASHSALIDTVRSQPRFAALVERFERYAALPDVAELPAHLLP